MVGEGVQRLWPVFVDNESHRGGMWRDVGRAVCLWLIGSQRLPGFLPTDGVEDGVSLGDATVRVKCDAGVNRGSSSLWLKSGSCCHGAVRSSHSCLLDVQGRE